MSMLQVTPEELRAVAARLTAISEELGVQAGLAKAIIDGINWTGSSHQEIVVQEVTNVLTTVAQAQTMLLESSAGLSAYATRIDEAR